MWAPFDTLKTQLYSTYGGHFNKQLQKPKVAPTKRGHPINSFNSYEKAPASWTARQSPAQLFCKDVVVETLYSSHIYSLTSTLHPLLSILSLHSCYPQFSLSTFTSPLSLLYHFLLSTLLSTLLCCPSVLHSLLPPTHSTLFFFLLYTPHSPPLLFPSTLISPLHPLLPTLLFTSLFCISLHYTDFTVFVFVLVLVSTLFLHSCSLHLVHLFSSLSTLSTLFPKSKICLKKCFLKKYHAPSLDTHHLQSSKLNPTLLVIARW